MAKVTQKQFVDHYMNLYNKGAIYVWGANGEVITKELIDKLYRTYGSSTYNRTYYNNKLKEGKGKIGADCSGSIYPLSKRDNTAKGYYNACTKRGLFKHMPKDTVCLVFNANFTHVGAYLGNGITVEMMSSTRNCVKQSLSNTRWAYYGIPDWLEVDADGNEAPQIDDNNIKSDVVIKNIQKWCNNYCNAGLIVDGEFGPNTKKGLCKALQTYLNRTYNTGLDVDGAFGSKTKKACKVVKGHNELTYICQAMLYCKGYDMKHSIENNNLDGEYGSGTSAAILKYQQNTRGLRHDGKCGPATFYAMFNS